MELSVSQKSPSRKRRGITPKKSLGQHFLKDPKVAEHIVSLIQPKNGDFLVEIGSGKGQITIPTLLEIKKGQIQCDFLAIEKDAELRGELQETLGKLDLSGMLIFEGEDALRDIPQALAKGEGKKITLFGNIPYYITGKLFRVLWEREEKPQKLVFMVQKEVAERICGGKNEENRLSAFIKFWGIPRITLLVPKKSFSPPPKIDSAIILVEKNEKDYSQIKESYETLVNALFSQPRKIAVNNLISIFPTEDPKKSAELFLKRFEIRENARAAEIPIPMLIRMAEVLYNERNGAGKK